MSEPRDELSEKVQEEQREEKEQGPAEVDSWYISAPEFVSSARPNPGWQLFLVRTNDHFSESCFLMHSNESLMILLIHREEKAG